jgi:hypothetical protein
MADTVTFEMSGLTQLTARFDGLDADAKTRVAEAMESVAEMMVRETRNTIRNVFRPGTRRLENSISSTVEQEGDVTTATIGSSGLPYAYVQEYGGSGPYEIVPVNARVLAFMAPGRMAIGKSGENGMVFTMHVNHPPLQERSYLRRTLAQQRGTIEEMLLGATHSMLGEAGFKMAAD